MREVGEEERKRGESEFVGEKNGGFQKLSDSSRLISETEFELTLSARAKFVVESFNVPLVGWKGMEQRGQ